EVAQRRAARARRAEPGAQDEADARTRRKATGPVLLVDRRAGGPAYEPADRTASNRPQRREAADHVRPPRGFHDRVVQQSRLPRHLHELEVRHVLLGKRAQDFEQCLARPPPEPNFRILVAVRGARSALQRVEPRTLADQPTEAALPAEPVRERLLRPARQVAEEVGVPLGVYVIPRVLREAAERLGRLLLVRVLEEPRHLDAVRTLGRRERALLPDGCRLEQRALRQQDRKSV